MDDILQRVFSILMATLVFFFLPLYIAFEKKDDISYNLALSITSNFVDDVTSKGYLTEKMYNDFVSNLGVTGNSYDIKLEHISKKYYPVIYAVDGNNNTRYFDYATYEDKVKIQNGVQTIEGYQNPVFSYKLSEVKYTEKQILEILDRNYYIKNYNINNISYYKSLNYTNIPTISGMYRLNSTTNLYPMNKGDEFTVVIKNTNTTVASVMFNVLSLGANIDNDTKVYINYGGTIQNEEYRTSLLISNENMEATNEEEKVIDISRYDINSDGKFDTNDYEFLRKYLRGLITSVTAEQKNKMDADENGTIDDNDLVLIDNLLKENTQMVNT